MGRKLDHAKNNRRMQAMARDFRRSKRSDELWRRLEALSARLRAFNTRHGTEVKLSDLEARIVKQDRRCADCQAVLCERLRGQPKKRVELAPLDLGLVRRKAAYPPVVLICGACRDSLLQREPTAVGHRPESLGPTKTGPGRAEAPREANDDARQGGAPAPLARAS